MSSEGTKRKGNSSSEGSDPNEPPPKKHQENVQGSSNSKNVKVENFKIFNDPVHGQIKVHPLCVKIIDTPQFQRLRYIKQLGLCYLVFPGAAHNRFEHSIGVYHLAGKYCRTLQTQQPELDICEKDVLCVQIAGLCHDLGHGPFSHVFDNMFIDKVAEEKWTHEEASLKMFDHLIASNGLTKILDKKDKIFIKELINPPKPQEREGRDKGKYFLYDIVANKRNGIDVDKWDYFLRDCHNLGISSSFDCHRFMECSRVIEVNGKKQICARDKEVENLYDMFYTRMSLHRRAYQHKTTKIIEEMLVEALEKANEHLKFKGRNDEEVIMSKAITDMVAYTKMTDDIIQQIMRSDNEDLKASQDILKRIERRQLYKYIGKTNPKEEIDKTIQAEIRDGMDKIAKEKDHPLDKNDIIINVVTFNYGCKTDNPIDKVWFYTKDNPDEGIKLPKDEVSTMLPEKFQEMYARVYYKLIDEEKIKNAKTCFEKWKELEREKQDNERKANPKTPMKKEKPRDRDAPSHDAKKNLDFDNKDEGTTSGSASK